MIGVNKKQLNKNKLLGRRSLVAFTLIEVLISVTLFSVIVLAVTSLFKLSIDAQRNSIATQNVQESLKYFLEVTAKEIRMAQRNSGPCFMFPADKVFHKMTFNVGGSPYDQLFFKNYYGECVVYSIDLDSAGNKRFKISRIKNGVTVSGFISPAKINISKLNFSLSQNTSTGQPMVTINLRANYMGNQAEESEIVLQTSLTSRYYKD